MRSSRNITSWTRTVFILFFASVVFLGACARPPSATVNKGADPFNVDKDVVFRTTYYFRVFDYCVVRKRKEMKFEKIFAPFTDSLYRFRMTGKAGTNVSDVKFESGTLMAWQIDPFSAKVEFDSESRRARVISPREIKADAHRSAIIRDIEKMTEMYNSEDYKELKDTLKTGIMRKIDRLAKLHSSPKEDDIQYANESNILTDRQRSALLKAAVFNVLAALRPTANAGAINEIVEKGFGNDSAVLDASNPENSGFVARAVMKTIENAKIETSTGNSSEKLLDEFILNENEIKTRSFLNEQSLMRTFSKPIYCPDELPMRRGFQVLGPEGWRTFNQDERLMLAMSSSAKPLISTLKELSNRVINAHDNHSEELPLVVLETKRLSEAVRALDRGSAKSQPLDMIAKTVCTTLLGDTDNEESTCEKK